MAPRKKNGPCTDLEEHRSRALLGLQSSEPPSRLLTAISHRRLAVAGRPLLRIEHMIETLGLSPLLFK
jgi:hypothetical protein